MGFTPLFNEFTCGEETRGKEIETVILNTGQLNNFVILDDIDDGVSELFSGNFIKVNDSVGLTIEDCQSAMEILN